MRHLLQRILNRLYSRQARKALARRMAANTPWEPRTLRGVPIAYPVPKRTWRDWVGAFILTGFALGPVCAMWALAFGWVAR